MRFWISIMAFAGLASCVAPSPRPLAPVTRPALPPRPAPAARPATPTVATPAATRPIAAGSWLWESGPSRARFVTPAGVSLASLTCESSGVVLRVARSGASPSPTTVTLRATTTLRTLSGESEAGFVRVSLAPREPLLDALAFSRGRIGIAVDGVETSYPSWPEIARVLDDCRRP